MFLTVFAWGFAHRFWMQLAFRGDFSCLLRIYSGGLHQLTPDPLVKGRFNLEAS
jgi:hypothetical protein